MYLMYLFIFWYIDILSVCKLCQPQEPWYKVFAEIEGREQQKDEKDENINTIVAFPKKAIRWNIGGMPDLISTRQEIALPFLFFNFISKNLSTKIEFL